jgi:hypothetical protein
VRRTSNSTERVNLLAALILLTCCYWISSQVWPSLCSWSSKWNFSRRISTKILYAVFVPPSLLHVSGRHIKTYSVHNHDCTRWSAWKKKLHGLSPRANYTDRATSACRRSDCQLVRIEGATSSAWRIPPAVFSRFSRPELLLFYQVAPQLYARGWVDPVPDPLLLFFLVVPGIEPGPPDL